MNFSAVSQSGDSYLPKEMAPTAPGNTLSAGVGRNDVLKDAVPTCRRHWIVVAEVLERGGPHPTSCRVPHAVGDDEEIARVLVEELVGLGVQRVGRRVPDDLVDADDVAATATVDVAQADEEHGAAAHARDVDRPGEWDREARLEVEAVERVDDVEIGAIRHAHRTVRLG